MGGKWHLPEMEKKHGRGNVRIEFGRNVRKKNRHAVRRGEIEKIVRAKRGMK